MKRSAIIMGMPITIEILDLDAEPQLEATFDYFRSVDRRYSTYKPDSEISSINRGLPESQWSEEMRSVLWLCEETKQASQGYFNITRNGRRDPSGLVKGWAITNAANRLLHAGLRDFYIEAGGDIEAHGHNPEQQPWRVGIRNPFAKNEIIRSVHLSGLAIATSGTYIRGQHIYNPHRPDEPINDIASLTVIGPTAFEADRFATAAFAMGRSGIDFIAARPGLEGYMIGTDRVATFTSGFERYVSP